MLAFAFIVALTASSALAKPTGNCIFMCDGQQGFPGANGAYTQPGFGQMGSGFQGGNGYNQPGAGYGGQQQSYGRPNYGYAPGATHGNIEDFGTEQVYPQGGQPAYRPQHTEVFQQQQIPIQPQIDAMFSHSSSKSSFEANNGFVKIHQPALTRTVVSEPIRRPRPARICQDVYDPCNY